MTTIQPYQINCYNVGIVVGQPSLCDYYIIYGTSSIINNLDGYNLFSVEEEDDLQNIKNILF